MSNDNNFEKRGVDYSIKHGERTLPGKYYHDEGIYSEEVEKIFYKFWIYACREEELPNFGDYKIIKVEDESIILVRDKENEVRGHFNVCRHRGTQLCAEEKGSFESKNIQCPYHAWTYGLDGKLIGAPLMAKEDGFNKEDCTLHHCHVHSWEGFIFISLSENPEPFEVQMEALVDKFSDWRMGDLRIAHHIEYKLDCNWKLILQNYQECYHCPGVHPLLSQLTPFQSAQHDHSKGAVIGGFMELTKERGSMTMDGEAAAPPVCDVSGDDLQRIYYYSLFPNMLLTPHPDFVLFHHITPKGPGSITNNCYWLFHPDVIADKTARERIKSAVDFWDLTNRQDWTVCEQMQKGTGSRRFTRGYYSGQEDILLALDKELLKALGHDESN
ncbi:MAG TPA: aromatic ring-hydroxylating dioxygenase subunit alpha [Flavobacteriales bacterium]|nr:aromatic ring-hydroxylating dioxygenase subunit alpha [Flavobacteriales bacterium]HIO73607.1 aromatic ring-hydroxylating dioxygenase subunit alpha [Flavobacteriales bacterium]